MVQARAAMVGGAGVATEVSYCTALSCACSSVCLPAAASGSSHGVAWVVGLWKGKRRPDGWTSTPRASRGAAAKTTPGSPVCFLDVKALLR